MSSVTLIKPTKRRIQKRLRVAAYARVSVEKSASENSIISQIQHFRSLIEANPIWINVGLYSDLGISGTKNTRPGFMQLIKDCNLNNNPWWEFIFSLFDKMWDVTN